MAVTRLVWCGMDDCMHRTKDPSGRGYCRCPVQVEIGLSNGVPSCLSYLVDVTVNSHSELSNRIREDINQIRREVIEYDRKNLKEKKKRAQRRNPHKRKRKIKRRRSR